MGQYATDLLSVSGAAMGADHRRQVMVLAWVLVAITVSSANKSAGKERVD